MERRKALKNIGLTFGAFVATPTALSFLQSCQSETPWMPTFLTEGEGKVVRKLVDGILPASGELPSATEVNVHVFIDKYMNEVISTEDQEKERAGLTAAISGLLAASGKESVSDLKSEDYDTFLDANLRKTEAQTDAMSEGSDEKKVYSYLADLRGRSIWAYKNSERVGETILAYKSVPGEQKGCVTVEEATGGKVWSL